MKLNTLSQPDWARFERDGFLNLGRALDANGLAHLRDAIDDIMLGRADVPYDRMLMQLDSASGDYADLSAQTHGFKVPTTAYRKIQDLEHHPAFASYMAAPGFEQICRRTYGAEPVACYRAMFMNKPASAGTVLPWHQDRWHSLDRDPMITIWTALDDATEASGCMEAVRGSHRDGIINPSHPSAFLTARQARKHTESVHRILLEAAAGEALLLHNWLLHRSGVNLTGAPRRAFSVCYMLASTVDDSGEQHPLIFDAATR